VSTSRACASCLARTWLLGRLEGHLEQARAQIEHALALDDEELIAAVGGRQQEAIRSELVRMDVEAALERARRAGLELICRCQPDYPARLLALARPPAVLHVAGGLDSLLAVAESDPVAIVGARKPSPYGTDAARSLGRGLGRAGVPVVSGMALGVDSAAHAGALAADAATVAVLPGSACDPYPPARRALHRQIVAGGAAVSELGPGAGIRRWMFPARNRIIAALAATTVVVEAAERSGALLTAAFARGIGRPVGAVPGRITTLQAAGPNALLAAGAYVVRGAQDVLDQLFGAGLRAAAGDERPELAPDLRGLLGAIAEGHETAAALARVGFAAEQGLAALASLELGGYVRRQPGGRFSIIP
jgi:DNA processing protein